MKSQIIVIMTFIAISKVLVKPDVADKFEEAFRNRSRMVDSFDGFIGLNFLRSQRRDNLFIGIFHFKDKESFKRYMTSKENDISHNNSKSLSPAIISNSVEFYDLITN
jgi:heme oxygenase (mycobilin-producing)